MTCPENCQQHLPCRALTPEEAAIVGPIPDTDHRVRFDPMQRYQSCGLVFSEGRLENGFPVLLRAGHFDPTATDKTFIAF